MKKRILMVFMALCLIGTPVKANAVNNTKTVTESRTKISVGKIEGLLKEIKKNLKDHYKENEKEVSEVIGFVDTTVKKHDLKDIANNENIKELRRISEEYKKTDKVDNSAVMKAGTGLVKDSSVKAIEVYKDAEEQKILGKLGDVIWISFDTTLEYFKK